MARLATLISTGLAVTVVLAVAAPAAGAAPPPDDQALALRLRPRLLFDSGERWRPLDVDRFLAEPGHLACPPAGAPCTPLADVAQLTPAVDHLDLRGDGPADAGGPSVVYAHVVRARKRVAIDYWWFLRYNAFSLDRHEGDWEGMTVIVDPGGQRVLDVHFAAHSSVWRYDADVPSIVDHRVKVYVARGSHASYPRRCTRLCRQTDGTLPESRFDGARSWVGNSAAGCQRRCVRLLPESGGAPSSWNAWNGRWGVTAVPAFPPPLTPAFQRRFQHPFDSRHSGRHAF